MCKAQVSAQVDVQLYVFLRMEGLLSGSWRPRPTKATFGVEGERRVPLPRSEHSYAFSDSVCSETASGWSALGLFSRSLFDSGINTPHLYGLMYSAAVVAFGVSPCVRGIQLNLLG